MILADSSFPPGANPVSLLYKDVNEIYLGKTQKFLTVLSNLETEEPLWFGQDGKLEAAG